MSEGPVLHAVDIFGLESKAKAEDIPLLLPASLFTVHIFN